MPSLGGLKPGLGVAPGHHVLLDAGKPERRRNGSRPASHQQPHRRVDRHVQLVDLARAVRMLRLPHPLLGDDVDFERVLGRRERGRSAELAHQKIKRNRSSVATVQPISTSRLRIPAVGRVGVRAAPVAHGEETGSTRRRAAVIESGKGQKDYRRSGRPCRPACSRRRREQSAHDERPAVCSRGSLQQIAAGYGSDGSQPCDHQHALDRRGVDAVHRIEAVADQ